MAARRPLVLVNGREQQIPSNDSIECESVLLKGALDALLRSNSGTIEARDATNAAYAPLTGSNLTATGNLGVTGTASLTNGATSPGTYLSTNTIALDSRVAAGSSGIVRFANDLGVVRWQFGKNGTAEAGANAGSDFSLFPYSDAGSLIGTALFVSRANMNAIWGSNLIATSHLVGRAIGTEGGQLVLAYSGNTVATAQGLSTWNVDVDSTNAFRIFRVNSSNANLNALSIAESTGITTITQLALGTPLSIANGGTDGNTAAAARSNLGVPGSSNSTKTANYTVAATDAGRIIECNAASAGFVITLPAASSFSGTFTIRKTDTSANVIIVLCSGSDTIFGASTFTLNNTGDLISLTSTGVAAWAVLDFINPLGGEVQNYPPLGGVEGLTLSRNATTPNSRIDFAAGRSLISMTNGRRYLALSNSVFTKRLDTVWATGTSNGGRFSAAGAVSANQWWHCFIMRNDASGAIDFGFDTSVSGTNKPTGWSVRRIGSIKTDGSSNILDFSQVGNNFYWKTEPVDVSAAISTTAALYTISVPSGLNIEAIIRIFSGVPTAGTSIALLVSSPLINDQTPGRLGAGPSSVECGYMAALGDSYEFEQSATETMMTNTSAQIRARSTSASYATNPRIATVGWYDSRGAA